MPVSVTASLTALQQRPPYATAQHYELNQDGSAIVGFVIIGEASKLYRGPASVSRLLASIAPAAAVLPRWCVPEKSYQGEGLRALHACFLAFQVQRACGLALPCCRIA